MPWGWGGGPWWLYYQYRGRIPPWRCFRFPWLPHWWWAYPEYWKELTPKEEKEMLLEELKALREEIKAIKEKNNMPKRIPPIPPGGRFRAPGRGGRGRMGGFGLGPGGECICPNCETKVPHERGIPCYTLKCPKCGTQMTRAR